MRRIWALAALAAGIWLLSAYGQSRPQALGLNAPVEQFSAARADAVLGRILDEQHPHPAGSAESSTVRARILKELADLDVPAKVQTQMSCFGEERWGAISCGSVSNIIAEVVPGHGKQIVLMAHSDSVAAGPGAGDDASGIATILESIRALKARGLPPGHPVIALFTDGEENGLMGAAAYLRDPVARARTGAVINVESRGNQGPSYLFQTGPGDARLIDLYAGAVPHYAASSLYAEIYKYMPNDTDMTPFLAAGLTGYNFAFIGNAAQYHTPLDRRENIDPRSLQQHGDNLLGLADALSRSGLANLKSGNAIYLDVLGRWLPRLPQIWSLPLSIAAFALIALGAMLRGCGRIGRSLLALLMPPLLLAGCIGIGFALHGLAAWISGQTDPSFAHPAWLRLSLAFGVFAVALMAAWRAGATACWLWLAGLAIVCSLWAPGAVPYFLFPCLVAAPLLLASMRHWALITAALAAMLVWLGLNQSSEIIMGLRMHPLFTVTAAFALIALLPVLAGLRGRGFSAALSLLLAIGLAVTAGLQPTYSEKAPERLNLRYVENDGKAWWLAGAVARLPDSLRAAANFSATPQRVVEMGYAAPAGPARHAVPAARVSRDGDTVTLDLKAEGEGVALMVPAEAKLRSAAIGGVTMPGFERRMSVVCGTPDCAGARVILNLASSKPVTLVLLAYRAGLPPGGAKLLKARPPQAVPSQSGDRTILAAKIEIPAR
ncbi:MAG: M20/M25/M40 family metallo-hydrolase [Rhizomicrobium sp.]